MKTNAMELSFSRNDLMQYLERQLGFFFPDQLTSCLEGERAAFDLALDRLEYCFSHISYPSYCENGVVKFSHLHSDQYCQFLWFYANSVWRLTQNKVLCDKLVCMNKALNGILMSYRIFLPDIFLLGHPVGTVLGNAEYHDFLVVLQNVTVEQSTPLSTFGQGVFLGAGAKVVGTSSIGNGCSVGANTVLRKAALEDDEIAYTAPDGLKIAKSKGDCAARKYFNCNIEKRRDIHGTDSPFEAFLQDRGQSRPFV